MAKAINITYEVCGRKEIEATTKALQLLDKSIDNLRKKGITLNITVNENHKPKNRKR